MAEVQVVYAWEADVVPKGHHGKDSKYWHIRLREPADLKNMKTVERGPVKQIRGISKRSNEWVDQNVMVKKKDAKKSGSRLIITNKKVRKHLKEMKIPLSRIFRRSNAGDADYKIKKVKNAKKT